VKSLLALPLLGFLSMPFWGGNLNAEDAGIAMADEPPAGSEGQDPGHGAGDDGSMDMNVTDMGMDMNVTDMNETDMNLIDEPSAVQDEPTEPTRVGSWTVREDRSGCSISTLFENLTFMTLGYDSYDRDGFIYLGNSNWQSIVDGRIYYLTVQMPPFPARTLRASGMWAGNMPGFAISFEGVGFVTEFMESERISISNGRNPLGSFDLEGSYAAAVELARCNRRTLQRVPRDPFAD
jgi:hypothetical protein